MRVRHGRAQHEGMRHSREDYVVSVAASPGDKAQNLMTPHRLTDTEFHAASSHSSSSDAVSYYGCMRSAINSSGTHEANGARIAYIPEADRHQALANPDTLD